MATPARAGMLECFGAPRALVGMIHVGALPGTPRAEPSFEDVVARAVDEAKLYRSAGFTALAIENMHDRPYLAREVGPEIVAAMTVVGREVRREVPLPLGVQVLAGANREALAVALAIGAAFVRVEAFVFAHVADEGLLQADAGALLRYRKAIGAGHLKLFADVKKKHASHAITADLDVAETARAAAFALADGVIVTGMATGSAADAAEVEAVSAAVPLPVLVGSGIDAANLGRYGAADGFIVGSSVKRDGLWSSPLDPDRVAAVARAFAKLSPRPSATA